MDLDMVYPKHDPAIWNTNNFLNPEVESWYVNILGAYCFLTIFVWVSREVVGKVSLRRKIVKRSYKMDLYMVYPKHTLEDKTPTILWNPKW